MKIGNDACKARQLALWERATAPISSSNNLVRVDYFTALFFLNSTLWHRSEYCILKSLGYKAKITLGEQNLIRTVLRKLR
ncbi:hypothetical protein [Vibrio caribbeanicus]|uniref:hypothetical protein n=1 Tax=Vibrio caribbeanicus TaxID=701175 RepID=UPI0030D73F1B